MGRRAVVVIVSVLAAAVVLSIVGVTALYLIVAREPSVPRNATLVLKVGGALPEVGPADVVSFLRGARSATVHSVVENLRKAKVDPRIGGVLLEPTGFESPFWGKVQEVRDAVLDFRTSGKPVYAYVAYGGDKEFYLASAADKVFLMPSSTLDLTGVATYQLFLRGSFDKLGVVPDLHRIGDFKTAVNTFTEKGYTAAHREMDQSLNRDLYAQIVRGVAEARRMTEAEVRALIDKGPLLADEALASGLVDAVGYEDQADQQLRAAHVAGDGTRIEDEDYARISPRSLGLDRGPRIAVIYATGTITSGKSGFDPMNGAVAGSDTLTEYIRQARRDASIRAIVLRIDSPGGSAPASDALWHELSLARTERADRPLVASMSDLAASGGYYIAMAAPTIVAQPSTLTGSIGIFGGKYVTAGLYEKLGAHVESTSIGRHAEIESPARAYTPEEVALVDKQLKAFYDQFVAKAAESRHTTPAAIDAVARGRVWTGAQAKAQGLVDELGGLDRAVALAKARAKIPAESQVELVIYPPKKSVLEMLSDSVSGSGDEAAASAWLAANLSGVERDVLRTLRGPATMFRRGELLALMPLSFVR